MQLSFPSDFANVWDGWATPFVNPFPLPGHVLILAVFPIFSGRWLRSEKVKTHPLDLLVPTYPEDRYDEKELG